MSTVFGINHPDKEEIYNCIRQYAKKHKEQEIDEIIENIMEAVSYGLKGIMWDKGFK